MEAEREGGRKGSGAKKETERGRRTKAENERDIFRGADDERKGKKKKIDCLVRSFVRSFSFASLIKFPPFPSLSFSPCFDR